MRTRRRMFLTRLTHLRFVKTLGGDEVHLEGDEVHLEGFEIDLEGGEVNFICVAVQGDSSELCKTI